MNRLARLAAVIAPVLGLAALWGLSERTYYQGTDWEVPIQGYDPRDYLRGHYVEFSYDWPGIDEFRDAPPEMLCLEGDAPNLTRITTDSDKPCAHPIRADAIGRLRLGCTDAWAIIPRARPRDGVAGRIAGARPTRDRHHPSA